MAKLQCHQESIIRFELSGKNGQYVEFGARNSIHQFRSHLQRGTGYTKQGFENLGRRRGRVKKKKKKKEKKHPKTQKKKKKKKKTHNPKKLPKREGTGDQRDLFHGASVVIEKLS